MKICVVKNEQFKEKFQKDFLKVSISCPSLNKFLVSNPEIRIPFSSNNHTKNNFIFESISIESDTGEENYFHGKLVKFKEIIHKHEFSDIDPEFRTCLTNQKFDLNVQRSIVEEEKLILKKFDYASETLSTNYFSLFERELAKFIFTEITEMHQVKSLNVNEFVTIFTYPFHLELRKSLKELNDSDIVSEILNSDFQDQKLLKVKDLKSPKRWIPKNLDYFLPNSIEKSRKELDFDVNWNYVNILQSAFTCSGNVHDLVLETEWESDKTESKTLKIHILDEEIQILEEETECMIPEDQELVLQTRSSIDTQFLVDRFMNKRGRASSMHEQMEVKKPKIDREELTFKQIELQEEMTHDVLELECPKFDQENAKRYKYIANSIFFSRRELVNLLESKYAIDLVERNFNDEVDREDIIVDEHTCIILHTITDLLFPIQQDIINCVSDTKIGQKVLGLSLRYSNIFILLSEVDLEKPDSRVFLSKIKIDPFTPPIRKSLFTFYQFSSFLGSSIDVNIQIFFTGKYDHMAWWIRTIGENQVSKFQTLGNNRSCSNPHAWNSRSWIMETESPSERFLSMFPVMNSFQAQIMLSQMSIREILNLSKSNLVDKFKTWIPEKNLLILYSMTHMKLELKINRNY